jgi:hypothetical protein
MLRKKFLRLPSCATTCAILLASSAVFATEPVATAASVSSVVSTDPDARIHRSRNLPVISAQGADGERLHVDADLPSPEPRAPAVMHSISADGQVVAMHRRQGALFKVSRQGQTSYLFGTIHVGAKSFTRSLRK